MINVWSEWDIPITVIRREVCDLTHIIRHNCGSQQPWKLLPTIFCTESLSLLYSPVVIGKRTRTPLFVNDVTKIAIFSAIDELHLNSIASPTNVLNRMPPRHLQK